MMIKGEIQITDAAALGLSALPLSKTTDGKLNVVVETQVETTIETSIVERVGNRLDVKNRYARLKRRIRTRSSSIF